MPSIIPVQKVCVYHIKMPSKSRYAQQEAAGAAHHRANTPLYIQARMIAAGVAGRCSSTLDTCVCACAHGNNCRSQMKAALCPMQISDGQLEAIRSLSCFPVSGTSRHITISQHFEGE